jgi:hypothetical protein
MNNEDQNITPSAFSDAGQTHTSRRAEVQLYRVTMYRTEYNNATVSVMAESEESAEVLAREEVAEDGFSWKHADAEETIGEIELVEGGSNV